MVLTAEERKMIMSALGGGSWYVCKNNHPYIVTECGTPTQVGTCPACGSQIGGHGSIIAGNYKYTF